jgi:hypothetical protein
MAASGHSGSGSSEGKVAKKGGVAAIAQDEVALMALGLPLRVHIRTTSGESLGSNVLACNVLVMEQTITRTLQAKA